MDVANDSGFCDRKTYANNRQVIFSSLAGELQESDFNLFSTNSAFSITVEGHGSWSFGETAESQSSLVGHTQSHDWVLSSQYLAGLLLGISRCISPQTRDIAVRLTTGLPYRDFQRGKEFRNQFKHSLLGNYHIARDGVKQTIDITSVLQIPQAFGPPFFHLLTDKGELRTDLADRETIRVGSVNVGGNTVEVGTIDVDLVNMRLDVVKVGTHSRSIGVFTLLPILREMLQQEFKGAYFTDYELLRVLKTGKAQAYDKSISVDISPIKMHLYRQVVDNLLSKVYSDELKHQLYAIISTGGGANLLDLSKYHNIWQSDDPVWDTCFGYSKARKLKDRIDRQGE